MDASHRPGERRARGRLVLGLLSAGTLLIVSWLVVVLATVLPSRSPASIPTWAGIVALAVVLVVAGAAWLARPGRGPAIALRGAGVAVGVVGAWLITSWLRTPSGDGGEGYLLLIGAWFLLHGAVAVLSPGLGWRARRSTGTPARPAA